MVGLGGVDGFFFSCFGFDVFCVFFVCRFVLFVLFLSALIVDAGWLEEVDGGVGSVGVDVDGFDCFFTLQFDS